MENLENFDFAKETEEIDFHLYRSKNNYIESILVMAGYYYFGLKGFKIDYSKSFSYFQKAVKLGDSSSLASLGYMYLNGIGIKKVINFINKKIIFLI